MADDFSQDVLAQAAAAVSATIPPAFKAEDFEDGIIFGKSREERAALANLILGLRGQA